MRIPRRQEWNEWYSHLRSVWDATIQPFLIVTFQHMFFSLSGLVQLQCFLFPQEISQRCRNPGRQVAMATEYCIVAHNTVYLVLSEETALCHRSCAQHFKLTYGLTEVFPCFFLSCKANARVKPAKVGTARTLPNFCVVLCIFCVLCIV